MHVYRKASNFIYQVLNNIYDINQNEGYTSGGASSCSTMGRGTVSTSKAEPEPASARLDGSRHGCRLAQRAAGAAVALGGKSGENSSVMMKCHLQTGCKYVNSSNQIDEVDRSWIIEEA